MDPTTGEQVILHEYAVTEREAEEALERLFAAADALKTKRVQASFGDLLDAWFPKHDVGPSTKATYGSLIHKHIRPALGAVRLAALHQSAEKVLEGLYADLARCSQPSG